jgi:large subunit ribosomal protein L9
LHSVRIVLHPEVTVTVTANIAQSAEEAELRAKGIDPMRLRDADEAEAEGGAIEPPAAAAQAAPR